MRVLVYDPYVPREAEGLELRFCGLTEALRRADFVSLHCVLTPETRGLIGAEQLRRMKNSAFLINVSRGALVDEQALADALRQGQIAGAGLDVFEVEPLTRDHPLLEAENVVLSPHFAFYTREAYQRLERQCLAAIRELLEGRIPPHVKNTEILEPTPPVAVAPSSPAALPPQDLRMEGDVNRSSQRVAWQQAQLDARTREVLAEDARFFMHQSLSTPCLNVLSSCRGSEMVDLQGRRILDFHGNSAHQVGYGHPRVIEAVKAQLDELPFCPRRYTNPPAIELAKTLASLAPGKLSKVLLTPSGTAAMGIALKLARYATRRHQTISMWGSFHGASLDAISIGGEALFRDGLGPLLPGCHHVPWPQREEDAELIERAFRDHGEVGAVIAEPMRCTTMERPPNGYWHRVRELCDHHGALLVFDEIPLALGRTGKMFCCEHAGVTPDILVIGKGLGGGVLPLAAVLARDDLDVVPDRALGHYTHEKSPVAAAAALATLQVLQEEDLLNRSQALGARALDALRDMQQRHRWVRDVRGLGLALGVELGVDELDGASQAEQVMYGCLARGLSFKVSGGNVLTLTPPLVISEDELNRALSILDEALAELV